MTPILGPARASVDLAEKWALKRGADVEHVVTLAPIYWTLAPLVGVRPEVAWVQALHETGNFHYGRAVTPEHYNYCGLKVRNPGADDAPESHARFPTPEVGVQAHLDHLALYAGAPGYPRVDTPDPRHFEFIAGDAPNVEDLGGRWAPRETYGVTLAGKVRALILSAFG